MRAGGSARAAPRSLRCGLATRLWGRTAPLTGRFPPPAPRPLLGFGSRCSTDGDPAPGPWPRPRALREPPALVTEPTSCVVVTLRASGHLPELSLEGAVAAVTITVRWEREEAACTPVACCARSCGPARRALPCAAHRPAGETRSRRGARPHPPAPAHARPPRRLRPPCGSPSHRRERQLQRAANLADVQKQTSPSRKPARSGSPAASPKIISRLGPSQTRGSRLLSKDPRILK